MTLRERIEKILSDKNSVTESPNFRILSHFYEEMKKEGAVLKKPYGLPLLDTVGRRINQEPHSKSGQGS